jgi:hypothetical protein
MPGKYNELVRAHIQTLKHNVFLGDEVVELRVLLDKKNEVILSLMNRITELETKDGEIRL